MKVFSLQNMGHNPKKWRKRRFPMVYTKAITRVAHLQGYGYGLKGLHGLPCGWFAPKHPSNPSDKSLAPRSDDVSRWMQEQFETSRSEGKNMWTHRIHGTLIFTYIYNKKSTIHVGQHTSPMDPTGKGNNKHHRGPSVSGNHDNP